MTDHLSADALEALREGAEFEAKAAQGRDGKGAIPESIWESYVSMANTDGGTILLGADERNDSTLVALGLKDHRRVLQQFWTTVNNPQKVSSNILRNEDVRAVTVDGCPDPLLLIAVPPAPRHKKPLFVGLDHRTGIFRRDYECDILVTDEAEIRRMFAESTQETRDGRVLKHFSANDLDAESIARYRVLVREAKSRAAEQPDTVEFLRLIGGWRRNEEAGVEGPTFAGLLMFGTRAALLSAAPNLIVDYQEHIGTTERWSHRVHSEDLHWPGNLFDFYRQVREQLRKGLQQPFQMVGGRRVMDTEVEKALREALTNTIIHADYDIGRAVKIDRYPERIEFVSPGELRIPTHQVYEGGRSDCRNRNLQRMFQAMGEGEQGGTGYPTMLSAWRAKHWRPPVLQERRELPEVKLTLSMQSLLSEEVEAGLVSRFGSDVAALSREAMLALEAAALEGSVTNLRLRLLAETDSSVAAGVLRRLVASGYLEKHGERQHTSYVLRGSFACEPLPGVAPTPSDAASIPHLEFEHPTNDSSIPHVELEHPTNDSSIPHSDNTKLDGDIPQMNPTVGMNSRATLAAATALPEVELGRMLALPKVHMVRSTRKQPTKVVEEAILDLLSGIYLTPTQVGAILNRNPTAVQERYLGPLARVGRLEMLYPTAVKHPLQAYKRKTF